MFVGSADTLAKATRHSLPVTDDRPIQEYSVRSRLDVDSAVPGSVSDLNQVAAWCPKCFAGDRPVHLVEGLDTYLALLGLAYAAPMNASRAAILAQSKTRAIAGSAYLGAVVPESADLHNILGTDLARKGEFDEAIAEFREALRLAPDSAVTHGHLGAALVSRRAREEGLEHLHRSVELDPANGQARYEVATILLDSGHYVDAAQELRATVRLIPNSVEAHNSLGVALASQGQLDEAIAHFEQALRLQPAHADAQRNLRALSGLRLPRAGRSAR